TEGLLLTRADGPTNGQQGQQVVVFDPLPSLAAGGDAVFRVSVRGQRPGAGRVSAEVTAVNLKQPLRREANLGVQGVGRRGAVAAGGPPGVREYAPPGWAKEPRWGRRASRYLPRRGLIAQHRVAYSRTLCGTAAGSGQATRAVPRPPTRGLVSCGRAILNFSKRF